MYLEHFKLDHPPFLEEPDVQLFYPGAQRELLYKNLITAIVAGKPLITLVGDEGSGKTLICRKVIEYIPSQYEVVYIDNPIGSFDDLLRIICLDLGMHPTVRHDSISFFEEFKKIMEKRRQENKKVLVIFDEAEKIFLASLERLLRVVGEAKQADSLCVVLSGRQGLAANLQQLSGYCDNVNIEGGYTLEPLTSEETGEYLKFRLEAAGLARDQQDELFSVEAVAKIHDSAQGNVRMINILAEESLQNSCSEKSFMVLLDHVDVEPVEPGKKKWSGSGIKEQIQYAKELLFENKLLAGAGIAALLLVIVLGMLLSGEEEVLPTAENQEQEILLNEIIQEPEKKVADEVIQNAISTQEEQQPEEQEMVASEASGEPQEEFVEEVVSVEEQVVPEQVAPEQVADDQKEERNIPPEEVVITEPLETPEKTPEPVVEKKQKDTHQVRKLIVVKVRPDGKKRKPDVTHVTQIVNRQKQEAIVANGRDGRALFRERRRASVSWLAEAYKGSYTIQLMMLTSDQAERNLMKMLVQDQYYSIKDRLYILRKKTMPPTLFVYYGIYKTLDEARNARNNMPIFLRQHHPYALAISAALNKAED